MLECARTRTRATASIRSGQNESAPSTSAWNLRALSPGFFYPPQFPQHKTAYIITDLIWLYLLQPRVLQKTWQSCANFCTVKGLLRLFWNLCSCFWGRLWGAARYLCHFYKFLTLWVILQYSSCILFSNSFSVCFSDSYRFGLWSWCGSLLWSTTRADHLMWKMCWFYWGFSPVGIACLRVSGKKK
jgi:hypothetical protein